MKTFTLGIFSMVLFSSLSATLSWAQEQSTLQTMTELAQHSMKKVSPKNRKWNWEDAIFMYGLSRFGMYHPDMKVKGQIHGYLSDYQGKFSRKGVPKIKKSDDCAPALAALSLALDWTDFRFLTNTKPVSKYILNEPRNSIGTLNHLGHSAISKFYPQSVWVDSLMMMAVPAIQMGYVSGNNELLEFARKQPALFASKLRDPSTKMLKHAWFERKDKVLPGSDAYWLRGNGWYMVALAEILDRTPGNDETFATNLKLFQETAEALLPYQSTEIFLWNSILNSKKSKPEPSGTALVAYAYIHGFLRGWLPLEYFIAGRKAYGALQYVTKMTKKGRILRGISGRTHPGGRASYFLVPRISDLPYGVGALLLLAGEVEKLPPPPSPSPTPTIH